MFNEAQLRQLIQASTVLTDAERSEWLALLPFMNDKQMAELLAILSPEQVTGSPSSPTPTMPPAPAPTPVSEPVSTVPKSDTSSAKSGGLAGTTVSAFLDRNFANTLHRGAVADAPIGTPTSVQVPAQSQTSVAPTLKAPPIDVTPPKPQTTLGAFGVIPEIGKQVSSPTTGSQESTHRGELPVAPSSEPIAPAVPGEEPVMAVKSLEDIHLLNLATLRARGIMNIEADLQALCNKLGYFSVRFAFEQSSLYRAYVEIGSRILREHKSFEELQGILAAANEPYLTKPEFEELSDLLRRIKSQG